MKKRNLFLGLALSAIVLLAGCKKQKTHQPKTPPLPPISAGQVHPNVPYLSGGATFAVYLPANYDKQRPWPVLFFFDAHARGSLPVKRYRKLADQFGMIFIGANNLKNGLNVQAIENRANNLFEEASKRFNIQANRKYIMGFSGGARSAVLTAFVRDDVTGVIGCGAGFPQWGQPITRAFAYIAIGGKGDFNLSELRVLNEQLNRSPIRHWLLEFNGSHEWPPVSVTKKALAILQLDAIRNGLAKSDPNLIGQFVKEETNLIDSLKRKNDLLALADEYRLFINTLEGMGAIQSVKKAYKDLLKSKAYQRQKTQERQQALQEVDLQKQIQNAFKKQDISYLKTLFHKLKRTKIGQKDYWVARRATAFMSLLGYLYAQQALQKKDISAAQNYLKIYTVTDPNNADRYYLQAWLDILTDKIPQARQAAKKALEIGLDDRQKIFANPAFSVLELH